MKGRAGSVRREQIRLHPLNPLASTADLTSPSQLLAVLAEHGFRLRHHLGQNFLVDRNVLNKVVAAAELELEDRVLEIGAGAGTLTRELAGAAGRTVAIEIDPDLRVILEEAVIGEPVEVIEGDVLKLDLGRILAADGRPWKVVANLPYYITTPVIERLLEVRERISRIVLMVQKEVAARLTAGPGTKDYGALTVFVQSYAAVRLAAAVSRHCFFPKPEVDSSLVVLEPRAQPVVPPELEEVFSMVVRAAFGQRRKQIANALSSLLGDDKPAALEGLRAAGVEAKRRGETLLPEEFVRLAAALAARLDGRRSGGER
jgi:16S rRNA (adenine1518-N6/adenine1519-N6)-dimethyltransferase